MRILITGGAGFIGLHTARALLARGDRVRILDALTPPVHEPLRVDAGLPGAPEGIEFLHGDIRDRATLSHAIDGIDAVIHLAAYQDYHLDFSRYFSVNATATALLYELIVERDLPIRRVVLASSQSVYGEGSARCDEHGVVLPEQRAVESLAAGDWSVRCPSCGRAVEPVPTPEHLALPRNAYGISKHAAETAALALGAQHGIPTVALRYAIVHGPGQSPRNAYSGLLRSACLALLAGRAPVVFEDGQQLRDYVAIEDAVSANLVALHHPDAPGAAYNVGGARSWSVLEVIDALNQIVPGPRSPEITGVFRVGDVRHTIGDLAKLRALGWEPVTDLPETWARYWEWLASLDLEHDIVSAAFGDMHEKGILRRSDG